MIQKLLILKTIDEYLPNLTIFKDEVKWVDSIEEEKEKWV